MIPGFLDPRALVEKTSRAAAASSRNREGAAVLILGLFFVLVLGMMQFAQRFLVSQVTEQAAHTLERRVALDLAESAITESEALLSERANDPASPLYRLTRQDFFDQMASRRTETDAATIALGDLRHTKALMDEGPAREFLFDEPRWRLIGLKPLGLPADRSYEGLLELSGGAKSTLVTSVKREVTRYRAFRLLNLGLTPPLNQATVFIRSPYQLVTGKGRSQLDWVPPLEDEAGLAANPGLDLNQLIKEMGKDNDDGFVPTLRKWYDKLMNEFATQEAKYEDASSREKDAVKDQYQFLMAVKASYKKILGEGGGGFNYLATIESLVNIVQTFPPDPDRYALVSTEAELPLEPFNLQAILIPIFQQLREITLAVEEIDRDIKANETEIGPAAMARYERHREGRIEQMKRIQMILSYLIQFRAGFRVVRAEGGTSEETAQFQALAAAHNEVDPFRLLDFYSPVHGRVTAVVEEDPQGPGRLPITTKLGLLLGKLDPRNEGLAAVVLVRNNQDALQLSGTVTGRLMILVTGSLEVKDLKIAGTGSVVTLVAMGGSRGYVKVEGTCAASLVVTGRRLGIDPGATILGSLVLWDVSVPERMGFRGKVVVDSRLTSLDRPEMHQAFLSPWIRGQVIER